MIKILPCIAQKINSVALFTKLANKLLHEFDVIVSAYWGYEFHRVLLVVGSSTARFAMD